MVFRIDQTVSPDKHSFVIKSIDRLRSKEWTLDEVPATPIKGVRIKYRIDKNGRMTEIEFPEATAKYFRIAPAHLEKWREVLKSSEYRLVRAPYGGERPYEGKFTSTFRLEYHHNGNLVADYTQRMSNHKAYLSRNESHNNTVIAAIADEKAKKIAAKKRAQQQQAEKAAQLAAYQKKVAAQKAARRAYEASPAGKKARAVAKAKYEKEQAEKRKQRLAKGWPSGAVGLLSRGSWVCGNMKSGYRAYMIERSGNSYVSLGRDCDYAPSKLFVSDIRNTSTGIMRISLIGGGVFYTSPHNIEQ